ncbi:MAG: DUF3995 domain-containing protein [Anaerolineae bacterium]
MNKNLLRFGGAVNLLFIAFHLANAQPMSAALALLSPDIRATISTMNIQAAFTLLIFACLAIFWWRDLLTTRLGNLVATAIALFWFLRAINQVVIYGWSAAGVPMLALCLVIGLLHLVPLIRERLNGTVKVQQPEKQQVRRAPEAQHPGSKLPWGSYVVIAWCVLFGGLHLYWALGGNVGFVEFSTPSSKVLALTRAPLYMAITWAVVLMCGVGAIVALAPFQAWSRRIPRWILLTPLWIACGLLLVRGFGNPIQSAVILGGGMPFDPLSASEAQAWNQWLLIDAILYSPYFILGGFAFGATARSVRRPENPMRAGRMGTALQG